MVYQTSFAAGQGRAVDTSPDRARYFRIVGSGTFRTGGWAGEIAQVSSSFTFGRDVDAFPSSRVDCPSTLIERITDTRYPSDARFTNAWRVWQTENIAIGPVASAWIHSDESDAIAVKFADFLQGISQFQDPNFYWDTIKIYAVNSQNISINGPNTYELAGIKGAGGTANAHPPQVAGALTWFTTGTQKGASGRTYVPMHHVSLTAEGKFGATVISNMNQVGKKLVNDLWEIDTLSDPVGTPDQYRIHPAVIHKARMTYSDVVGTGVGDLVDTQRRRRNGIPENYFYEYAVHATP